MSDHTQADAVPVNPQANPSANREQQLADGVLDRPGGEDYNPNVSQTVEENRAHFEAVNAEIAATHQHLIEEISPMMERITAEAKAAASDPGHQAMLADQQVHASTDPLATHAGKEYGSSMPPQLHDAATSPQPQRKGREAADSAGPAIPVQNNSLRKDE